jgi:hypothetical protein
VPQGPAHHPLYIVLFNGWCGLWGGKGHGPHPVFLLCGSVGGAGGRGPPLQFNFNCVMWMELGWRGLVGSSIVAIMLQLLGASFFNFINPVVRNKLGSDGAVCTSTSSCRSCHLVSWHKSARAQANFYELSEEAF